MQGTAVPDGQGGRCAAVDRSLPDPSHPPVENRNRIQHARQPGPDKRIKTCAAVCAVSVPQGRGGGAEQHPYPRNAAGVVAEIDLFAQRTGKELALPAVRQNLCDFVRHGADQGGMATGQRAGTERRVPLLEPFVAHRNGHTGMGNIGGARGQQGSIQAQRPIGARPVGEAQIMRGKEGAREDLGAALGLKA